MIEQVRQQKQAGAPVQSLKRTAQAIMLTDTTNASFLPAAMRSQIRALILDMDGVVWRGDQPLGDLPALFAALRQHKLSVVMATNNATLTIQQYLDKFLRFGVTLEPWQIVNSPQATVEYLAQRFPQGGPVYVIGEDGLRQTLAARGFSLIVPQASAAFQAGASAGALQAGPEQPLAVVVGMDRSVDYDRLSLATQYIRRGALFVGTNPDRTFPQPFGLVPGAGAILAAIEAATDTAPVIVGKPNPEMYRVALARLGTQPAETLVVGDRIETDITGGQALMSHGPGALGCHQRAARPPMGPTAHVNCPGPDPRGVRACSSGRLAGRFVKVMQH